ncbi:MAG: tetratricopeptide (TPR) repeat protein [Phycisphaerales bacterium]|jgi:tetratricopeptide (TPR) repeat protein
MPTVEQLEKLLSLDPADPFVLYGLAQAHAKEGRHGEAVGFYDRCLAEDPHYCYAYYHKARSQEAVSEFANAAATLEAGLEVANAVGEAQAISEIGQFLESIQDVLARSGNS